MSSASLVSIIPVREEGPTMSPEHNQESILIYVALSEGSMVPVRVLESDSIQSMKLRIQNCKGIFTRKQKIVCGGRELARSNSLVRDYGLTDGNVLRTILDTVVWLLPAEKGCVSCSFLFKLLKAAISANFGEGVKLELVKMMILTRNMEEGKLQMNSLKKEFGPKHKEQMQYCATHPDEINKLAKVKAQVNEVKGVMMENIEKVLERGEKIEVLVDKTDNLRSQGAEVVGVCGGEMVASVDDFFHHATAILAPEDGDDSRYFASLFWDFRRYYGRVLF